MKVWNIVRIVTAVLVVAFIIGGFASDYFKDKQQAQQETYTSCVKDAAEHLSSVVPGLSLMDARSQAMDSPRCAPLRP